MGQHHLINHYLKMVFFKKKIDLKLPFKNKFDNARYLDISFSKLPRNFRFSDRYSMGKSIELDIRF